MANIPIQFNMQNIAKHARRNLPQALPSAGYTKSEGGMEIYGKGPCDQKGAGTPGSGGSRTTMCTSLVSWVIEGRGEDTRR